MSQPQSYQCPSCGAPLPVSSRFVQTVTCEYCRTVSAVTATGLDPTGETARLTPLPTRFSVGASGRLRGRPFRILGRVRYRASDGQWDEWYLLFDDGRAGWLEEDEGMMVLSTTQKLLNPVPPFEEIRVGDRFQTNGQTFFVTEKCTAAVAGSEGELFFPAVPGAQVRFVDGNIEGRTGFLEWGPSAIEFGVGDPVEHEEITLDAAGGAA